MPEKIKTGHRQRLRERFLSGEKDSRSEEALLEILLTYAIPQQDVRPLAQKLLAELGALSAVLDASVERLCQFDGIKSNTAALIKIADWIRLNHNPQKVAPNPPAPIQTAQMALFDASPVSVPEPVTTIEEAEEPSRKELVPRPGAGLFGKSVLMEAIQLLPGIPDTDQIDPVRNYLRTHLYFSAEQTRQRRAGYIIRRMFPLGYADRAMRVFARSFSHNRNLSEVCFYRFMKAEPLVEKVILDLLLPSLNTGRVLRQRIREFLKEMAPESRNIKDCAQAIVDTLSAGGVAKVDRTKITFGYRDIPLPAFAFVLHSEFPEPGMYDLSRVETHRGIRAMLWNPDRILTSLYELRNRGILSKISEIDNVRQFTTKWSLERVVEHLSVQGENG